MKLELKHLAGYFPYGLKGISTEENLGFEVVKGFSIYGKHNTVSLITNVDDIDMILFKPILRPLSDFGDSDDMRKSHEFIGLGKWCKVYDEFFKVWFDDISNIDKLILQAPQEIFNYFLANHFDVFRLIENDLAISIHNVEQGEA